VQVLISERLGEDGSSLIMESVFGPAVAGQRFGAANRGLFTHDLETKVESDFRVLARWC